MYVLNPDSEIKTMRDLSGLKISTRSKFISKTLLKKLSPKILSRPRSDSRFRVNKSWEYSVKKMNSKNRKGYMIYGHSPKPYRNAKTLKIEKNKFLYEMSGSPIGDLFIN